MASKCKTALVDPPTAITTAMAFSNASLVIMSRGRKPRRMHSATARAVACALSALAGSGAAIVDDPGSDMPIASIAADIVLAVNIPPHEPTDGQAFFSMPINSSRSILPAAKAPTASKLLTMVKSRPRNLPGKIVPP